MKMLLIILQWVIISLILILLGINFFKYYCHFRIKTKKSNFLLTIGSIIIGLFIFPAFLFIFLIYWENFSNSFKLFGISLLGILIIGAIMSYTEFLISLDRYSQKSIKKKTGVMSGFPLIIIGVFISWYYQSYIPLIFCIVIGISMCLISIIYREQVIED